MSLGGILDRAVQLFRARYMVFFGLASIAGIAELAKTLASVHPRPSTAAGPAHGLLVFASYSASFVAWLATVFLGSIVPAAICVAASRANLGEKVSVHDAYGAFSSWRMIALALLQAIYACWPLFFTTFIALALSSSDVSVWFVAAVWILGGIASLALYTRYALAYPASAIEGLTARASIERSAGLSAGGRWQICWGVVVALAPALLLSFGVLEWMDVLKGGNALLAGNPLLVAAIEGMVDLIAALIFTPYFYIVLTLLYYDQRMRREGFDVERMMHEAGLDANATPPSGGE